MPKQTATETTGLHRPLPWWWRSRLRARNAPGRSLLPELVAWAIVLGTAFTLFT